MLAAALPKGSAQVEQRRLCLPEQRPGQGRPRWPRRGRPRPSVDGARRAAWAGRASLFRLRRDARRALRPAESQAQPDDVTRWAAMPRHGRLIRRRDSTSAAEHAGEGGYQDGQGNGQLTGGRLKYVLTSDGRPKTPGKPEVRRAKAEARRRASQYYCIELGAARDAKRHGPQAGRRRRRRRRRPVAAASWVAVLRTFGGLLCKVHGCAAVKSGRREAGALRCAALRGSFRRRDRGGVSGPSYDITRPVRDRPACVIAAKGARRAGRAGGVPGQTGASLEVKITRDSTRDGGLGGEERTKLEAPARRFATLSTALMRPRRHVRQRSEIGVGRRLSGRRCCRHVSGSRQRLMDRAGHNDPEPALGLGSQCKPSEIP